MIEERKESQATMDKYNKKIECLMEQNPGEDCDEFVKRSDRVSTGQAAPAAPTVQTEVAAPKGKAGDTIKVLPYTGMTMISSENEELEAEVGFLECII